MFALIPSTGDFEDHHAYICEQCRSAASAFFETEDLHRVSIDHDWECEACGRLAYRDFNNSELLREMTLMIHSFAQGHWATHCNKYTDLIPTGHRLETASPHLNTDGTLRLEVQFKSDGGIETREYLLWPHAPRMANESWSCYNRMSEIIRANYLRTGVFATISPDVIDLLSPDTRQELSAALRRAPANTDVTSIVETVITPTVLVALLASAPDHESVRTELIRLLANNTSVSQHQKMPKPQQPARASAN